MALTDDRGTLAGPFEKQPPQDLAAEQSVLGGMMLSKDAIADVVEVLSPGDFYRPAHQAVYDCVLDLYGRGEPADPITVSAELERRGELGRVGGAPYLHTLIATVPTAANAGYYAEIVAEKAVLRRLVEAGTRIVQMGYNGAEGAVIDEVVDRAQAAIYEVTERRMSEDYVSLEELLQPTMDEIDAIASRGGTSLGVPTGFTDLDEMTNGLHPGQMIIVAARPGVGKALALDTPLPTPTGWTTMADVAVGDELIGADGRPTRVIGATGVLIGRPCFAVEFADGAVIVADAAHQWRTGNRFARRATTGVRTTAEIAASLRTAGAATHAVANARPLALPSRDLPLPPYVLGVWLAAGQRSTARLRTGDPDIVCRLEADGCVVVHDEAHHLSIATAGRHGVAALLRALGVLGNRHIPLVYRRASESQRRDLLAGVLDAGGMVTPGGSVLFAGAERRLVEDLYDLVVGLGYRCSMTAVSTALPGARPVYTLTFHTRDDVFGVERKRLVHKDRAARTARWDDDCRQIVGVRPVASVPVRCVEVAGTDHLYLAGRAMIPTHNSTLGLDFARSCSVRHGMTSAFFSLEMSRSEIVMRILSSEAKIRLQDMRGGRMSDDDWTRLARRMSEISEAPLFIDDSPNLTMMEIRAKARRLRQRHDLRLIVVDYLQLMTSGKRVESRQQEVSEFSRNLKLLAKELEVPVVAISQLNRGPEQRTDKRPMLADLRESGCLTRDTTLLRADTGAPVTFGALLDGGHDGVLVWSLDERRRMVAAPITNVFPSGVKETFRLTLASGRTVTASGNHRFRRSDDWVALDDLAVGDRLAVPRRIPAPIASGIDWSSDRLGRLARRVGETAGLPDVLYRAGDDEIRVFLRHLSAANGTDVAGRACYPTTSRPLADGILHLLTRLGTPARVRPGSSGERATWCVEVLDSEAPRDPADDVHWDPIVGIEPLGPQPVFDATVKGTHNFIADGIVAHNSLEQDADMVLLLNRPDAWERDDPRAGEADLIIAKHRAGPTATITVAHQLHYSRFTDLAQG